MSILLSFPRTPRQGPGIPVTDSGVRVRGSDVCKRNMCVSGAHKGQKVALDNFASRGGSETPRVGMYGKLNPGPLQKQQELSTLFYWALSLLPLM